MLTPGMHTLLTDLGTVAYNVQLPNTVCCLIGSERRETATAEN